jgi:fructose-1,6-bisphosphatase/sedoheptulose 1,7-bisphosphatase-like protein
MVQLLGWAIPRWPVALSDAAVEAIGEAGSAVQVLSDGDNLSGATVTNDPAHLAGDPVGEVSDAAFDCFGGHLLAPFR